MSDTQQDISKMSFEEAMASLEKVVSQLETGDVPLEKSIALYEHGAKLKAHCETRLAAAEQKVSQITAGPDGKATSADPIEIS